jgi:hypothetical protein
LIGACDLGTAVALGEAHQAGDDRRLTENLPSSGDRHADSFSHIPKKVGFSHGLCR